MTKRIWQRREVLRGCIGGLGVALAMPLLDRARNGNGNAFADQTPLPNRFGVFFWGNGRGMDASRWVPTTTGADFELSPLLAPLEGVKRYLNIPTGFNCKTVNYRGHHRGVAAMLSGAAILPQDPGNAKFCSTFSTPSIDQVAAQAIGQSTPFASLELGISEATVAVEGTTLAVLSHNGPDNVNPAERDPVAFYERLFADAAPGAEASMIELTRELRASALDAVWEDAQRLSRELGALDRTRIEQHMDNIRAIEARLQASEAVSCAAPARPTSPESRLDREPLSERMALLSDLIAVALSCDLTRVFSVQFNGSVGDTIFWEAGVQTGHHDLSHEGASSQEQFDACTSFITQQLAVLLQRFADTPDGDGNLLDHMAVLAASGVADGSTHTDDDMPIIVAGGANGALKTPGVHYRGDNDNSTDVLVSVLRAVGVPLDQFGADGGESSQGVSAIEA